MQGKTQLIQDGPFKGFGYKKYRVIVCDPPWKYLTRSAKGMGRSPDRHYKTMTIPELKALPVQDLAAKDCVLFMWIIDSHVELALEVVKAWGFKFKTVGFTWGKLNKDGKTFFQGTGHWTRANAEMVYETYFGETEQDAERCFLNTVGRPKRIGKDVPRFIAAKRREHSRKPDEIFPLIERLVDGPYFEMFGRQQHGVWSVHGDEKDKFNDPLLFPELMEVV